MLSQPRATCQDTVTVTGTNYGPLEAVSLFWDTPHGSLIARPTTGAAGVFVATFTVPLAISGTHLVIAVGQPSGKWASAALQVQPRLFLEPSSGSVGASFVSAGCGFGPQEPLAAYWDRQPPPVGTTITTAQGSFYDAAAVTVTVPVRATVGQHVLYAVGQTSHAEGAALFTVH
jgi:hypothetical protein